MRKAIIIRYRYRDERREHSVRELNEHLETGWRVESMSPMGGVAIDTDHHAGLVAVFASLVILEK